MNAGCPPADSGIVVVHGRAIRDSWSTHRSWRGGCLEWGGACPGEAVNIFFPYNFFFLNSVSAYRGPFNERGLSAGRQWYWSG